MSPEQPPEQPSIPFASRTETQNVPEKSFMVLAEVLQQMGAGDLPLGPKNSPCLNDLGQAEADELLRAQLRLYGDTLGFAPRVWRSPESDEEHGGMAHPAVLVRDSAYELLFTSLTPENDWQLVVAKNSQGKVEILNLSPQELAEKTSRTRPIPTGWYKESKFILPEETSESIREWMRTIHRGGKTLWVGLEAVMVISNADEDVSRTRSDTASVYWLVLNQIAINTGLESPIFICNGYASWEIDQMEKIALKHGIPQAKIIKVGLADDEATMHHAPRMIEQIPDILSTLKDIAFVTSGSHLARTHRCLVEGFNEAGKSIGLYPFGAPVYSELAGAEGLYGHEVAMLAKWRKNELRQNQPPSSWEVPLARSIWSTVAAGGPLPKE